MSVKYDFDKIIDRRGTNCLKYDFALARGKNPDALPMWVADMDFEVAAPIMEHLHEVIDRGIYGYSEIDDRYRAIVASYYKRNFDWELKEEWIMATPGIVQALSMAVWAYTSAGDGILLQQPVYYPFSEAILCNGRHLVDCSLDIKDGHHVVDFDKMEKLILENDVKLFLLCNPHNPGGRVWTEEELSRMGEICLKHGVVVLSDEIHSDFIYPGHKHTVFASLGEEYEQNCIICTSPTKTFNLAGLQISNIIVPNPELRKKFSAARDAFGYSQPNLMGMEACMAAYTQGQEWKEQMLSYIYGNREFMKEYLEKNLPMLRMMVPEGTYLVWVDCTGLGMTCKERESFVQNQAKLWLDNGGMFGQEGEAFERFNIACPRSVLKEALDRLKNAIDGRTITKTIREQ